MGCGKSKHDVVTGNTTTVRKPSEAESVKGKENETIKRQESCRCQKINDISAAVSTDRPETTVENNTKKPEEKEAGGECGEKPEEKEAGKDDCGEKPAGETNDEPKPEEKEITTLPPLTAIVPENIVTEETANDVNESVLPVDEQKEKVDIEMVVEEEKGTDDQVSGDVNTETPPPEIEEPKPDVQTPVTTESEVQDILTTENVEIAATENVETASTENVEVPVLKDEDKVDLIEENLAKEVESA